MATDVFTIVLKGKGHHDEGVTDAIVYPGGAVEMAPDGHYDPQSRPNAGLKIVKEDALQGKTIAHAYAPADILSFYSPLPGDHIHALVKSGEDINVGDGLIVESGLFVGVPTKEYKFPLTSARVHDALATTLPATATNDDMGIVTGTPGTDAPTLQGVDFGGTSTDEKCAFEFVLPRSYRAGGTITIRVKAAMLTTVSDGTATVDVEAWKDAGDGSVGSDLCATAAQDINSLTPANLDFTITPTNVEPGDRLIIRASFAGSDSGNAGVMIPEISNVAALVGTDDRVHLEALEDSGGALAANTHIRCRVLNP